MTLDVDRMLALDTFVRDVLGVGPGQSIHEVAERIVRDGMAGPALYAAHAILVPGDPWERMVRAAECAGWLDPRHWRRTGEGGDET